MAIVQIGVIVAAGRLARRIDTLAKQIEREVQPLFGHINSIGRDASRAAALAAAQVERADKLFADVATRVELALDNVQGTLGAPAREGRAFFAALKAAFRAIRDLRRDGRSRQGRGDDEDALFI
jgi:hypothetical protein